MSDTTIDDLLLKFVSSELNEFGVQQGAISENKQLFTLEQTKSALYELMLSVIGDDDKLTHNVDTVEWIKTERNQLRQEMRNKLTELMK